MPKKTAISLFLVVLLTGCALKPFVDTRREAGQIEKVGKSTKDVVAICYNSYSTTPNEVIALAKAECAKTRRVPEFYKQTEWSCSLLIPTHAYFRCTESIFFDGK